jgi:transcriptional regulator with XRE-family HTH domain
MNRALGRYIRKSRVAQGVTPRKLREETGLKKAALKELEHGDREPTVVELGQLLNVIDLDPETIEALLHGEVKE